jgi:hypothetical protein
MAITTAIANSFKEGMLAGTYDVGTDTFKLALYTSSASLGPSTTAYTTTGECTGTNYTAGGVTLTGAAVVLDANTVIIDFDDATFSNITVSDIRGFMIYDSSAADACVTVFDFGSSASVVTSNYTLQFPAATASTGLIRFTG